MRDCGLNMVAVNIFGWAETEPTPGKYELHRLGRVLERLAESGIDVNLGTGTASPPSWLSAGDPAVLPVDEEGRVASFGGRQAWCPSSTTYRAASLDLVHRLVEEFHEHPAVQMWHISNELGAHNARCYCDVSAHRFRGWLRARYETIDMLNERWGTQFWSQRYRSFDDVQPPRRALSARNPLHQLDFDRFSSDELLGQYRAELAVIRQYSDLPATTNFMVADHIRTQDYWSWADSMDVVANDHYLDHRLADPHGELAFAGDLTRGLAKGGSWFLMEQAASAVNWQPVNRAKPPGEMARDTMRHVARGADAVCFFQWRASERGAEKFHSALLPHSGTASPKWNETIELGRLLESIGDVAGSTVVADVAVLFDWENVWASSLESRPSTLIDYADEVRRAHRALLDLGVTAEIVQPASDLSRFKLAIVPAAYLLTDQAVSSIDRFVAEGGIAFVTYLTAIVDQDERIVSGGYGARLACTGITTHEFFPLADGELISISAGATGARWSEWVELRTATLVWKIRSGTLAGRPAFTRNTHERGEAFYLAVGLERADYRRALRYAVAASGAVVRGDQSIEVVERRSERLTWQFAFNHSTRNRWVRQIGTDVVTGRTRRRHRVAPGGFLLLRTEIGKDFA